MRPALTFFGIVAISASGAVAQEMPKARSGPIAESFDAVNKEFVEAVVARVSERTAAQAQAEKNGKGKEFKFDKPFPGLFYSPRFLAIAEKDPDGPDAIDALRMTLKRPVSATASSWKLAPKPSIFCAITMSPSRPSRGFSVRWSIMTTKSIRGWSPMSSPATPTGRSRRLCTRKKS